MASRSSASLALFLSLNLLFFAFATAMKSVPYPPPPQKAMPTPAHAPAPAPAPAPVPAPTPSNSTPPTSGKCPRDALKLGVCADVLGLVNVTIGSPPTLPCCSLIQGLVDLEAAVCLCIFIKASVLGISLNIPISLSLLLNVCGMEVPSGFQCA